MGEKLVHLGIKAIRIIISFTILVLLFLALLVIRDAFIPPTGWVGGQVREAGTLEPLEDVRVELETGEYTYTDTSGLFRLAAKQGHNRLIITKTGYQTLVREITVLAGPEIFTNQIGGLELEKSN